MYALLDFENVLDSRQGFPVYGAALRTCFLMRKSFYLCTQAKPMLAAWRRQ